MGLWYIISMSKYYKKIVKDADEIFVESDEKNSKSDYEENYWGVIKDPDGNLRNRIEEKDKFLANLKSELKFINEYQPSKILDVGCGLGFMLSGIDDKHEKFGLEVSSFACEHAKQYAEIYNSPIETAPIEENSFDIIVSHHVIEHVDKPEEFLDKIKKVLKKDGVLILSTPDFESICAKAYKDNYRMLFDKTHVNLFSFNSLKKMLTDYGFDIIDADFPYFDTEYFNEKNILNMLNYDKGEISPACWGNFVTFYCRNRK